MAERQINPWETLELSPGSSPAEVKKAYFRLVRQYTPEKDPERFQQIRAAYEMLKDGENISQESDFTVPDHPVVRYFIEQAINLFSRKQYAEAARLFESALEILPEDPYLLLNLILCQRKAGRTQKAAKTAEKLDRLVPNHPLVTSLLATSAYGRGWYKKALPAFQRSFALGNREKSFLMDYAACANDNLAQEDAFAALFATACLAKWDSSDAEAAVDLFSRTTYEYSFTPEQACAFLDSYEVFAKNASRQMTNAEISLAPLVRLATNQGHLFRDLSLYRRMDDLVTKAGQAHPKWDQSIVPLAREQLLQAVLIHGDFNLREGWAYLAFASGYRASEEFQQQASRFLELRGMTLLLAEESRMTSELERLRSEVPYLAQLWQEAADSFRGLKTREDRKKLQWEYEKLRRKYGEEKCDSVMAEYLQKETEPDFSGEEDPDREYDDEEILRILKNLKIHGEPEESYSEEEEWKDEDLFPSFSRRESLEQPIVRAEEKTGRNDPCPCGSGKKYKKCCGKNL